MHPVQFAIRCDNEETLQIGEVIHGPAKRD